MDGWETAARPLVNLLGDNLDWDHAAKSELALVAAVGAAAFNTENHGSVDAGTLGE